MSWLIIGCIMLCDAELHAQFPRMIAIFGIIAAAAGLAEYVTQTPFGILTGFDSILAYKGDAMTAINAASSDVGTFRIKGLFVHPIVYGQIMALMAPIALHMFFFVRRGGRLIGLILALGIFFSLYACQARSPFVVLAVCIGTYVMLFTFDARHQLRMAGFVMGVLIVVLSAPWWTSALFGSIAGTDQREIKSSLARLEQSDRATIAMRNSPLVGYGSGQAVNYAGVKGRNNTITLDSNILSEEIDGGYLRLGAYCLVFFIFFIMGSSLSISAAGGASRSVYAAMTSWFPGIFVGLLIVIGDGMTSYLYIAAGFLISGYALRPAKPPSGRQVVEAV